MAGSSSGTVQPIQAGSLDLDNPLWRFVLPFYGRDGVSRACLTLQDKLGVDVNILLFAIFAQVERSIMIDASDLAVLDALVRDWRDEIIQPLRRVRIRLKSGPAPAPSPTTDRLRNRIKAAELETEQIELAVLADWLDRQPPRPTKRIDEAKDIPLMVARYFQRQPADTFAPEVDAALDALSRAFHEASVNKLDHRS